MTRIELAPMVITRTCPLCGEEVEVSGRMAPTEAGFDFTSDEAGTRAAWDHQAKHDAPEALAAAVRQFTEAAEAVEAAADRAAAALGCTTEAFASNLQALVDARCWNKIPRCFNGWGVGICALPNRHGGDCNPIPTKGAK